MRVANLASMDSAEELRFEFVAAVEEHEDEHDPLDDGSDSPADQLLARIASVRAVATAAGGRSQTTPKVVEAVEVVGATTEGAWIRDRDAEFDEATRSWQAKRMA